MAKKGATKNYGFGQKNNWRRTIWNEVLSRTAGKEKHQPILYLAGPQDMDRQIAIEKGVPPQNLIAIDRDTANVNSVRDGKAPAIQGDIIDVLWSWPESRPACAVMLDFCCGITWDVAGVYDAFQRKPLRNAIVMVNFMRGRDAWSNSMREMLSEAGLLVPLWRHDDASGEMVCVHSDLKHRAYQFLFWNAFDTVQASMGLGSAQSDGGKNRYVFPEPDADGNAEPEMAAMVSLVYSGMRPKLFTYQSGALRFDSAVFQSMSRYLDKAEVFGVDVEEAERDINEFTRRYSEPPVKRRIAATLAVRTQRLAQ